MQNAKKLPSGRWHVQVYLGKDENGKKIVKSITADTKWQAEKEAWDYCNNGYLKEKKNEDVITVGEAIDNYMLLKSNVLSPSTLRGYRVIRRTRLQSLMDVDVHKVNSFELQKAINEDAARIGHKSLMDAKSLVSAALKLYDINTDWNVTLPPKKPIRKNLPSAQLIIDAIKGTDVELPCLLAMWLAMRMSEVTGLKFKDIDENGVYVNRSLVYAGKGDGYVEKDVNKTLSCFAGKRDPGSLPRRIRQREI